jgi:hypothetical protein
LGESDRESALVMRARAYIGERRNNLALADLQQALKLNPNDQEATSLRLQAQGGSRDTKQSTPRVLTWPNGDRYEGEVRDDKPNGRGVLTRSDGFRIEGEFREGQANGPAIVTLANGYRFVGELRDGRRNGRGILTLPGGTRYEGEYRDGQKNGRGVLTLVNGDRYEGEFRDAIPNGLGQLTLAHSKYNGLWANGCFKDGDRSAKAGVDSCPRPIINQRPLRKFSYSRALRPRCRMPIL